MKLSKREAIENHRAMWTWIAEESTRRGEKVSERDYAEEVDRKASKIRELCWLYEYAKRNCAKCPVEWLEEIRCGNPDSLYNKWRKSNSAAEAAEYARQIAELNEKESDER